MKTFIFSFVLCALLYTQVSGSGVKKCYFRDGIQNCQDNSVCYKMISFTFGQYFYHRGCTLISPQFLKNCQTIISLGGTCYMCDTDCCNL